MTEQILYTLFLNSWFAVAGIVFLLLFFISAPYGKYTRTTWGPTINEKAGWVLMEAPSPLLFLCYFLIGNKSTSIPEIVFLLLWQSHYVYRAFVYPLHLSGRNRRMPIVIMIMGICFNAANTYLNGRFLFWFAPTYSLAWLYDPRFIIGVVVFAAGYSIHVTSDGKLRKLRTPHDNTYKIPFGGMFRWVSCPNYLGEILEWIGWALLTWSVSGLVFAVWTFANLAPRAWAYHGWYHKTFSDYPSDRKALLPYLW